jgi:hypothetical protein
MDVPELKHAPSSIVVEINGQQKLLLDELARADPEKRTAEELIRAGFLEYAKTLCAERR